MPGDNCAVFGCGTSRRSKGVGIWKLPSPRDEAYKKWRDDWLNELIKTRELDQYFQKRIENDRIYTCEKHFDPKDIEIFHSKKMTKKKPRFGALPLFNMPKRSHQTVKSPPRPVRSDAKEHEEMPKTANYKDFSEVCKTVTALKSLGEWSFLITSDRMVMKKMNETFLLPENEIIIDDSLGFTIKSYGCFFPENHPLYIKYLRSIRNVKVSDLVKELGCYSICSGVEHGELTSQLVHHVIPVLEDPLSEIDSDQVFPHQDYWRSHGCSLRSTGNEKVAACSDYNMLSLSKSKTAKVETSDLRPRKQRPRKLRPRKLRPFKLLKNTDMY